MKKVSIVLLISLLLLSIFSYTGAMLPQSAIAKEQNKQGDKGRVPGQVIVRLNDDVTLDHKQLSSILKEAGLKKQRQLFRNKAQINLSNIFVLDINDQKVNQTINNLKQSGLVRYAEPNLLINTSMVPNDPFYSSTGSWGQGYADLWGLKAAQPESAWDKTLGTGIKVAVIDTGIDYTHPDLTNNIWHNLGETGLDSNGNDKRNNSLDDDGDGYVDDWQGWDASTIKTASTGWGARVTGTKLPDSDPMDDNGHGTHVAGTIAAEGNNNQGIIGLAPASQIIPVKFLTSDGVGTTEDAAEAIAYAVTVGAKVINASWSGGYSQLITDAVHYAYAANVAFFAAAGNNATSNWQRTTPANLPEAITVAATDTDNNAASFSNWGKVDISAPGVDILSTKSSQNTINGKMVGDNLMAISGTSMATPFAAGLAALVYADKPNISIEELRQQLAKTATDLGAPGQDVHFGGGLINANRALSENVSGQALITAPLGFVSETSLDIKGQVQALDFQGYKVEYGAGLEPASWNLITESGTLPQNNLLGHWDLSGLALGQYTLRLTVMSNSGQIFRNFRTIDFSTPLTISGIQVSSFSPQETAISWDLSRDVGSYVEYGQDTNYGSRIEGGGDNSIRLLSLQPETTYHLRVVAYEFARTVESPDQTFTTPAATFSVQNIQTSAQPHQATITWTTDQPADSLIEYDNTYWSSHLGYYPSLPKVSDPTLTTNHSVTISDLDDNREYVFIVKSKDAAGNGVTSAETYFTTPKGQYAVISPITIQNITEETATAVWDSDIPTTTRLRTLCYYDVDYIRLLGLPDIVDDTPQTHHEVNVTHNCTWANVALTLTAESADNSKSYAGVQFRTPESSHISNLTANIISNDRVEISWTTDVPTYDRVLVVPKGNRFGFTANVNTNNLNKSAIITGLSPLTDYEFGVQCMVGSGSALYSSSLRSFTTTEFLVDLEPPTGSIQINNNNNYTGLTNVNIQTSVTDNVGVTQMQFSTDWINYSVWEPYLQTKNITLSTPDGTKTVYARFKDAAGNVSQAFSDSIILDQTAPIVYTPLTATPTENQTPTFNWQAAVDYMSGTTGNYQFYLGSQSGGRDIIDGICTSNRFYTITDKLPYGTYFAYLTTTDQAGNLATSSISQVKIIDMTKPTGSIVINNDATYTSSTAISLTLGAEDNVGVTAMQFSNDGVNYSAWENFSTTKNYTLSGNGTIVVRVKYKDAAGNVSLVYLDSIILDQTKPTGSIIINSGANKTASASVTLNLTAQDTISGLKFMRFSNDKINWSSWVPFSSSYNWILTSGKGTKNVYAQFQDQATNISSIYSDNIQLTR